MHSLLKNTKEFLNKFTWDNVKIAIITPKYNFRNILLSIIVGVICGLIALSIFFGPSQAFAFFNELFYQSFSGVGNGFGMLLSKAVILGFAGLSVLVGMRSKLLNIGVSGQMVFGAFLAYAIINKMASTGVIYTMNGIVEGGWSSFLVIFLGFLITTIGASILAALSGFLKAYFGANEVISTILVNWIIVYLVHFIAQNFAAGNDWFAPNSTSESLNLKSLIFVSPTYSNTWGLIILSIVLFVISCFVMWFVFKKTLFGFKMDSIGKSVTSAKYAGYEVKRILLVNFTLSGFFAGLAGYVAYFLSSTQIPAGTQPISQGFLGIVVALVAVLNPLGIILAGCVFAWLDGPVGGIVIPDIDNPSTIQIFAACVAYFIAILVLWQYFKPIALISKWINKIRNLKYRKINRPNEVVKGDN